MNILHENVGITFNRSFKLPENIVMHQATKKNPLKIYFAILTIVLPLLLNASTWNGSVSNNWFDGANWNGGSVPGATDHVIISAVAVRMPSINGNTAIKSITSHNGTTIRIDTFSVVRIENNTGYGMRIEGQLENYGQIHIDALDEGIVQELNSGIILNFGTINVISRNSTAIDCKNYNNKRYAQTKVSSYEGIGMHVAPDFNNSGTIIIDTAMTIGLSLRGTSNKNSCIGRILINNCHTGLLVNGNFSNDAQIIIKNVNVGIKQLKSNGLGIFRHLGNELIVIENFRDTGILVDEFENAGYIELLTGAEAIGIVVDSNQIFLSPQAGQINLYGVDLIPIQVKKGGVADINYLDHRFYSDLRLDWKYGRNEFNRNFDSLHRNFLVHVPETYDSSVSVPLVLMLHGSSGTGTKFYNISRWKEKADEENFIVVFPTGLKYYIVDKNQCSTKWSSDGLQQDIDPQATVANDIAFLRELIQLCQKTFNIDSSKIYQCGFSNGGGFTKSKSLIEMNDIYAATCSCGGIGLPQTYEPVNNIYLPHMEIAGTHDAKIWERVNRNTPFSIETDSIFSIENFSNSITNMLITLELDTLFQENYIPNTSNTLTFSTDLSGQGNAYNAWIIQGLEHEFPNGTNHPIVGVDTIWPWLKQWTKN